MMNSKISVKLSIQDIEALGISCQISSQVLLHIAFYLKNHLLNIKQLIQINLLLFNRTQVCQVIPMLTHSDIGNVGNPFFS